MLIHCENLESTAIQILLSSRADIPRVLVWALSDHTQYLLSFVFDRCAIKRFVLGIHGRLRIVRYRPESGVDFGVETGVDLKIENR